MLIESPQTNQKNTRGFCLKSINVHPMVQFRKFLVHEFILVQKINLFISSKFEVKIFAEGNSHFHTK